MSKAATILVAVALALFGLAACGGDDDEDTAAPTPTTATDTETEPTGGGAAATVQLSAPENNELEFSQESVSAKPGTVTIEFDNPASLSHDVVLLDEGGAEIGRTDQIADSSDSFTAELARGTYTYYCSVPGHREGGMEGTLTVK